MSSLNVKGERSELTAGLYGAGCSLGNDDIRCGAAGLSSGTEKDEADPGNLCLLPDTEAKRLLCVLVGTMSFQATYGNNVPKLFANVLAQYSHKSNGASLAVATWLSIIEKAAGNK